jgi:hypothetical protein
MTSAQMIHPPAPFGIFLGSPLDPSWTVIPFREAGTIVKKWIEHPEPSMIEWEKKMNP